MRCSVLVLALSSLALGGCPAVDPTKGLQTVAVDQLFDHNDFVCEAMPVLVRRCSYLGCHGDPTHALRVYSPGKLRAGDVATRQQRDAALTADEVQLNFDSAVGVLLASAPSSGGTIDPQSAPLLLKPLSARAGGSEHHGVGIFPVSPAKTLADDPEWNALASWVAGKKQSPPDAACKTFFTSLGLTPK